MNNGKLNKAGLSHLLGSLIAGTKLHSSNANITLEGQSFTPQSLIETLESLADALAKGDAAMANWKESLAQVAQTKAKVAPIVAAYRSWLIATNGSTPSILGDYGLAPKKPRTPLTTEQKAAAAAKAKATRSARHTMGTKQKQGVKGNVTGVVVTPVTAPTPSAPPAKS